VSWLRRPPRLREDTPDGTRVEVVGVARTLPGDEPFVPPVRGEPCVVAQISFSIPPPGNARGVPTKFERLQNRPFLVVADDVEAVVDAAQLELKIERLGTSVTSEKSVPVGARVRVVGTVMRDAGRPGGDAPFRDPEPVIKIVGSRRHPVRLFPG